MQWYWIVLIIYGGIGFLLGVFIAFSGPEGLGQKVAVIIVCTIIWGFVVIVGIFEYIISGGG